MGTMNVETSWLGDAMNNMFNEMEAAPNNAAKMALTMEQIKKARAERIKEENVLAGSKVLGEAYDQAQSTYRPQEYWTPDLPSYDPSKPEGEQWDVGPSESIGNIAVPRGWYDPQGETAHRQAIQKVYGTTARLAGLTGKTSEIPGLMAYGQVGAYGVPLSDAEKAQLQFQTKGEFPVVDETKLTKQNYAWQMPDRSILPGGVMRGSKDLVTGREVSENQPPGSSLVLQSPRAAGPDLGPFASAEASKAFIAQKALEIAAGKEITPRDQFLARNILEDLHGLKTEKTTDAQGNTGMMTYAPKPLPANLEPLAVRLYGQLPQIRPETQPSATVPQAQPGATPSQVDPGATTTTGPPAAAGPAAAPSPIVQPSQLQLMRGGATSFSPYGPAAPSSNAQQLMAQRITQAQGAATGIEQLLGYNPQTGTTSYMPKLTASVLSEMYGGTVLGNAAVNFIDPKAGQYMQQAKLFVEPVLRIASGAAIRPEEYHDYFQMFIPMPGDPPALVKSKIDAMHVWAQTTGQAATTDQALAMMASAAQNNPVLQQQIVRVRNDATQSGRLGLPVYQAAAGAGQTQPGATPAPPPAAPPPPAVDHNRVKAILGMQ